MIGHHDVLELHHIPEYCTKFKSQIPVYPDSGQPWSIVRAHGPSSGPLVHGTGPLVRVRPSEKL